MTIRGIGLDRVFLGWDRPILQSIADELVGTVSDGQLLDLSEISLVLPGAQAGRRLKEILLERAEAHGRSLRPPEIHGVGRLPELLYRRNRPQPGALLTRIAWTRALEGQGRRLRVLIPDPEGAGERPNVPSALVGAVRALGREIGAAGRDFRDVQRLCMEEDAHTDEERWGLLAEVQERYRTILAAVGYQDVSEARAEALSRGGVRALAHLWIAGVPELPTITGRFVKAAAELATVRILIAAPSQLAHRFDETGCVIPSEWTDSPIEIPDEAIRVATGPADQADAAIDSIRSFGPGVRAEDVTIGVPDPEIIPYLVERLEEEGVHARDVGGKGVEQTGTFRLLRAVERFLSSSEVRALEDLLRHPAFEGAVQRRLRSDRRSPSDLVTRYQALHFQRTLSESDLPDGGESVSTPLRPGVREVVQAVDGLLEPFEGDRPLSDWIPRVARFLRSVFDGAGAVETLAAGEAAEMESAIGAVLAESQELPPSLDTPISATSAIGLLLEEIRDEAIPPGGDANAIPLMGWLELALDDAPDLVVTGFNEPFVPASVGADAFLPHSMRRAVGLPDNEARWARDAWILATALRVRRRLALVVGRRSTDGDPRLPSRLLFAVDRDTVAKRMLMILRDERSDTSEPAGSERVESDPEARGVGPRFVLPPERVLFATEPVERISVTAFRRLLADPFLFALTDVLRIREVSLDPDELDPMTFGTLAHEVLRAFGEGSAAESGDPAVVGRFLDERLDLEVGRRFGTEHLASVGIQVGQLRARFHSFAEWQAGWYREGWRIRAVEQMPVGGGVPFEVDGEPILLTGKIDRIDENVETGRWVLLDYKTGERADPPNNTHRRGRGVEAPWVDLQLPLYRRLAAALEDGRGAPVVPASAELEVGYVALPRDLHRIGVQMATWGEEELAAAEETAREAVRTLRENRFVFHSSSSTVRDGDYLADIVGAGVMQLRDFEAGGGA